MAERFKAPVLKTGVVAIPPWVRIPLSPPISTTWGPARGAEISPWCARNRWSASRIPSDSDITAVPLRGRSPASGGRYPPDRVALGDDSLSVDLFGTSVCRLSRPAAHPLLISGSASSQPTPESTRFQLSCKLELHSSQVSPANTDLPIRPKCSANSAGEGFIPMFTATIEKVDFGRFHLLG